ncbi:MAG: LysR family transcriptional regulator [Bdellovibrionaceae bacterium]|nr:LysR family transcriptional regulator [Pseudobdellovibrionaceae bacterium]
MEIFELRYFLAVAQRENLNRAATEIHVSPGSLSKAIARLEDELQTPLFFKSGRGIRLTPEGELLRRKAAHILQLEEDARLELRGRERGSLNVYISSEEILQTSAGLDIAGEINALFPSAKLQFLIRSENQALEQVRTGEAHLALITQEPPQDLVAKTLSRVEFLTCAGKSHPLVKKYGSRAVPVEELLKHPFVAPDSAILGKIAKASSIDGWRDDKFPRQIKYKVCGLKLMENLVDRGLALAYLPDYFIASAQLVPLKVSGCPYTCTQTIRVVTKDPAQLSWLGKVWDRLDSR